MGAASLLELFRCEMDAVLMGEVIDTLHHRLTNTSSSSTDATRQDQPSEQEQPAEGRQLAEEAWSLLSCLPRTGRFALSFQFLSGEQRARAAELVSTLTEQLQQGGAGQPVSEEEMRGLAEALGAVQ